MKVLRWRLVFPMIVLAGLVGALVGTLVDSPRQEQHEADRERDASQSVISPSAPQNLPGSPPHSPNTRRQPYDWYDWVRPDALTNIALIVVAIWAGCIAIRSLRSINTQSRASVRAARAAHASAAISLAQKRLGDRHLETSKAIERAYIYVHSVRQLEGFTDGGQPTVLLNVINSGHTFGWILRTGCATIPVSDVGKNLPRPMPVQHIGMRQNKQIVFAGQHTTFGNKLGAVAATDYAGVQDGTWKLVVFGRIEYRDTFDDTHHTDFSFVWDQFKAGSSGPGDFHIHPDGYTDAN